MLYHVWEFYQGVCLGYCTFNVVLAIMRKFHD